jgi:hypothetical protein
MLLTFVSLFESVRAAKAYLDTELAKYETWEDAKEANCSLINILGNDIRRYTQLRNDLLEGKNSKGVGQTTILKFLGKNWRSMRHGKNALIFLLRHYLQEQREILYMLKPKE